MTKGITAVINRRKKLAKMSKRKAKFSINKAKKIFNSALRLETKYEAEKIGIPTPHSARLEKVYASGAVVRFDGSREMAKLNMGLEMVKDYIKDMAKKYKNIRTAENVRTIHLKLQTTIYPQIRALYDRVLSQTRKMTLKEKNPEQKARELAISILEDHIFATELPEIVREDIEAYLNKLRKQ